MDTLEPLIALLQSVNAVGQSFLLWLIRFLIIATIIILECLFLQL